MASEQQGTIAAGTENSSSDLWCGTKIPVIGVTGDKWSGKSVFVSSIDPENTLMVDLELSTESYGFIKYKKRISLYHELSQKITDRAPSSLDCWLWFNDLIETIKPGDYSVVAIDPINDIEAGLSAWIYENGQSLFGHSKKQYDYASGTLHGDIASYWKLKLGILASKISTLAFTTHIGLVWGTDGKPLPGKTKAKGRPVLTELASLYLQMERKPGNDGIVPTKPIGRVIKSRLMVGEFIDGEMKMYPVLGGSVPDCTPNKIREMIKNPIGKRAATDAEKAAPEVNLTEDERLLLKSQIVGEQLQIEQSKSSRMELLAAAAKRNSSATVAAQSQPLQQTQTANIDAATGTNPATESDAEKTKRTRRTKDQIAADNAKEAAGKAAKESAGSGAASTASASTPDQVKEAIQTVANTSQETIAAATQSQSTELPVVIGTPEAPFNPTGEPRTVHQTIMAQFAELNRHDPKTWSEANFKSTLKTKFNVDAVHQLAPDVAEGLRKKLWDILTKAGLDGDAKGAMAPGN